MKHFPLKTALALATAVAALALYRTFDKTKGLSPTIFPEATHLTLLRHKPDPARKAATAVTATTQTAIPPKADTSPCTWGGISYQGYGAFEGLLPALKPYPSLSPNFIDDCGTLDPFFAALQSLEAHHNLSSFAAGGGPASAGTLPTPKVVTILHYGDSPTTADLITGDIRDLLQQRFGDAGRGFLLTAKPWAWYQHRGVDLTDRGWQTSTAVGKGRPEVYGIGGASFTGNTDATTHITLKDPTQTSIELSYEAQPNAAGLTISANNTLVQTIPTAAENPHPVWQTIPLPQNTKTIDLRPTGPVRLFGETLLTNRPGVLYDSLGLNGASTSVLSNGFNAEAWQTELRHTQPALVIINYGTNESGFGAYVDKQYEPTLRTAILRIRTALPGEPILVMSPMDRGRRAGVDQIETYDTIPRIIAIQRRVAADLNCAFFDTFDAMGGDGTMARWYTGHPRLVAGDLIHPTPQGASIVAHLFVHDLSLAYDRYLGHQPTTSPVGAPSAPTPNTPHNLSSFAAGGGPASPPAETSTPVPPKTQPLIPTQKPKPSAAGEPAPVTPPTPTPDPPANESQLPPSL